MNIDPLAAVRELGSLGLLLVLTLAVIRHLPNYILSTNKLAASMESLRVGLLTSLESLRSVCDRADASARAAADVARETSSDLAARLRAVERATAKCPAPPRDPASRERADDPRRSVPDQ
jgi:hypothetical protein